MTIPTSRSSTTATSGSSSPRRRSVIRRSAPQWTDLSPGDPGMVLVEVFAYLTDLMIYRLNRVPESCTSSSCG